MDSSKSTETGDPDKIEPPGPRSRKRGTVTRVACNKCRDRKSACDGVRPICGRCRKTNTRCSFDAEAGESRSEAIRRENDALRRENEDLRRRGSIHETSPPDSTATVSDSAYAEHAVYSQGTTHQQASPSDDAESQSRMLAVSSMYNANLLHPAAQQLTRMATPDPHAALELELMVRHPVAYPNLESPELNAFAAQQLQETRDLFVDVEFWSSEASLHDHNSNIDPRLTNPKLIDPPNRSLNQSYCDLRLQNLKIGFWTHVAISDDLAANLISLYLETDHPVIGLFDADLFLDDLTEQSTDFCSSLLVNAVLLWSCHSYAAFSDLATFMRQRFLSETLRLWNEQGDEVSVLTMAAAFFLNMTYVCCGDDRLAATFIRQAHNMAESLQLYGPYGEVSSELGEKEGKELRSRSHAAWGAFNFVTLRAMNYRDLFMKRTPKYVIPGDSAVLGYTIWRGTPVFHQLPAFMGNTFTKLCKLWLIVNEVALAYFAHSEPAYSRRFSIEWAEITFQKLLHWADTLDASVSAPNATTHHEEIFHIFFHSAMLDLFRPFVVINTPLRTFSSQHKTPRDVFMASVNQLKRHVLTHPSKHPSAVYSIFWHTALLQVANAALTDLGNEKSQLFFLLCIRRYHDLAPSFPVMSSILRGLLGVAVRSGALSANHARLITGRLSELKGSTPALVHAEGAFALDLTLALTDFNSAQAERLFEEF